MQLLPAGQQKNMQYTLLRLAGKLTNQQLGEFASFDVGSLAAVPNPEPFFRQEEAMVPLDRCQVKRFEDARGAKDAYFQIMLAGLVWYPTQQKFEAARPSGYLEVSVPRSQWVDRVLSAWNLANTKIVEIKFASSTAGENFRVSYAKIDAAERLFANGQWKQTLGELYSAFESLAAANGYAKPDQQFFAGLLSGLHAAKKEKFKLALDAFCDLLQLGRHEPKGAAETFSVSPQDARFALTMARLIFEYVTSGA
jgi:hypothetical protein